MSFVKLFSGANMHMVFGVPPTSKGIGKSHFVVNLMNKVLKNVPNAKIFTNIVFKRRTGKGEYDFIMDHPPGVTFVIEMAQMFWLMSIHKMKNVNGRMILFLDEVPNWLSNLDGGTKDVNFMKRVFNISRKFPLCIVCIGPLYWDFPKPFIQMTNVWWSKDIKIAERLGKDIKKIITLNADTGDVNIDNWNLPVNTCEWTMPEEEVPIGGYVYEQLVPSTFDVCEFLYDNKKEFMHSLSVGIYQEMATNLFEFLDPYCSKTYGNETLRKNKKADSKGNGKLAEQKTVATFLLRQVLKGRTEFPGSLVVNGKRKAGLRSIRLDDALISRITGLSPPTVMHIRRKLEDKNHPSRYVQGEM